MDIKTFRASFSGQILEPTDEGYNEARLVWNASFSKHPKIIARCSGITDVIAAVNFGHTNNLLTAIRGGGHNVGGRALCDDGLVIDLSRMRSVFAEEKSRTVRVEGGATLGDLDRETHVFGLAVPCGIVPKTGIGGLTLGGWSRLAHSKIRDDH
jgi:FAD/FMN-containing dehydrogenase